jgi:hypothetical protein
MGLFDIFNEPLASLGKRHAIDLSKWNDGYDMEEDKFIEYINSKIDLMSNKNFLRFLKGTIGYRKFIDQNLEGKISKVSMSKPLDPFTKNDYLPYVDYVFYPAVFLDKKHNEEPTGYIIVDSDRMWDGKKTVSGNFKSLILIHFNNNQDYWGKKINYEKEVRSIGFQYVDLDEDEYNLLKPFESKLKKKHSSMEKTWGDVHVIIYNTLFKTEKRKKFPINRFQTYLAFEE